MHYKLSCTQCGASYDSKSTIFRCEKCKSILEVKIDYKTLRLRKNFWKQKISQSKYSPFFPISSRLATLGEGGTKLIELKEDAFEKNFTNVFLKIETTNPTKSFKDRGSSVEITKAIELGYDSICCASTGNMGISLATYSKRNGIDCTVFMGRGGNRQKMRRIEQAGAKLVKIVGDFNKATLIAERHGTKNNFLVCGDYHYRKEGQKSVAYEIAEQLEVLDYVFIPVGNATLIAAMYKGFSELIKVRKAHVFPKFVASQSLECDPLVRAYQNDTAIRHVKPSTMADAIAVGKPTFGKEGLLALKKTHGFAVGLEDAGIEKYRKLLYNKYSVAAEPGGAVGFACFMHAYSENKRVFAQKSVVVVVTGNNGSSLEL